jgi:signal recognition particle subunit SRP54
MCCWSIPPAVCIDEAMMAEIKALHAAINPIETLFVVDSMTGQDAANTAKAFSEALPLTGVILTKTDGDARGGAALSVRYITGRPIKFLGAGEKTDALEPFHPDRLAQRILGMGDVLSLVEEVERKVDQEKAQKLAQKVMKGKRFDLNDMKDQLEQMGNMGGLAGLMDKLPGMSSLPDSVKSKVNDKRDEAHDRDHQFDDQEGAPPSGSAERFAPCPRGAWLRHPAGRRQPPAQAVHADGKNDVQAVQGRHQGPDAPDAWCHEGHGRMGGMGGLPPPR